jgi:hypothetical protein
MLVRQSSFVAKVGVCFALFASLIAAQTAARHTGENVQVIDLSTHPEADVLVRTRAAFRQGDIVRIPGGNPEDLQRLLGVGGASLTLSETRGGDPGNALLPKISVTPVYEIVAARATETGALHAFVQMRNRTANTKGNEMAHYEAWVEKERRLTQEEENGTGLMGPQPPQAWTELQQTTFSSTDDDGNFFQNTISIYRLNDTSPSYDWYMILTDPESQPNYKGCTVFGFGSCGWWTHQRVFTMSTTPQAVLFDHGPINTITSSTASFSIGVSWLSGTAGYSVSWPQQSVTTTDESDLTKGIGKWNEAFQDEGTFTKPPETSTGLFLSHQGSIFQVPEGTTSFQFTLDEPVTSAFQPQFGTLETETQDLLYTVNISPPVFVLNLNSLSIPPGGSGNVEVTAVNPSTSNSNFGLPWNVTNIPSWLTVSQLSGSSSANLKLTVAAGTRMGSVASLNVNTNPEFAAPSVEKNPLLLTVTVGQPNDTGIMMTGGFGTNNKIEGTADLYSPQLGQFDFEAIMQPPRADHTATLLISGDLLVTGGSIGDKTATATAELFHPDTGQFSATEGMMTDSRSLHTATLLQNGSVLITGGIDNTGFSNGTGNCLATAELYDPGTKIFAATSSMTGMRCQHSSTLLLDGTVLLAGGLPSIFTPGIVSNTAETYDPGTAQFTATAGNMTTGVYGYTATLLKDGHVLIAGGASASVITNAAELYNPQTRTFSATSILNVARINHTATLLPDGTVLITGGQAPAGGSHFAVLATAELYDPQTQTFTLLSGNGSCPGSPGCMTTARMNHTATLQLDGTVLIAFGSDGVNPLGSTETYNPQTRTFSPGPTTTPRFGHAATLLQRPATTITLRSSLNPSEAGQKITLTATVKTGDGVAPAGSVMFLDDTTVLSTVPLQPSDNGIAGFSLSSLTAGPHSLTAQYSGDGTHAKSTSSILVQKVKTQGTTTTLGSSANPSNNGQLVTFTATVTATLSGTPTGSVTFRDNGAEMGIANLTGNTAHFSTSSLGPGPHPITATYSGDAVFGSSGSPVLTQNVNKLTSTVSVTSSPNPTSFGQTVAISATVKSSGAAATGSVQFRDGTRALQIVPLQSGVAQFKIGTLSVGSHSITGAYSGDLTHAGATSAPVIQTVNKISTTTGLTSTPNPSKPGQTVMFTATVSSGSGQTPTGTVTFLDGKTVLGKPSPLSGGSAAVTVNSLSVGEHSITAAYSGDASHSGSTSPALTQTVAGLVTPTVVLAVQPNSAHPGDLIKFTATVSYPGGPTPTGTVTISNPTPKGNQVYGIAVLDKGVGVATNSTIQVGTYNLVATYGGDGGKNYTGAQSTSVPLQIEVGQPHGQPSIAITALSGTPNGQIIPVQLTIANNSTVKDYNITLDGIALRAPGSAGEIKLLTPTPVHMGTLAPGALKVLSLQVQADSQIKKLIITENGTVQDQGGKAYEFSLGQALFP